MNAISVIVPYYKTDFTLLQACVEAVLEQEELTVELELIVVDNHPDFVLYDRFPDNHRLVVLHEPTPGSYAARNAGIRAARGSILAFTDSDCLPHRRWLKEGIEALQANPKLGLVGGDIVFTFRDPASPSVLELYDALFHLKQETYLRDSHFAVTANVITRRSVFELVGPFDERQMSGGDLQWGQRVWRAGYAQAFSSTALVCHPARPGLLESVQRARRICGGRVKGTGKPSLKKLWREIWIDATWRVGVIRKNKARFGRRWRLYAVVLWIIALQIIRLFETLRLSLGGKPVR